MKSARNHLPIFVGFTDITAFLDLVKSLTSTLSKIRHLCFDSERVEHVQIPTILAHLAALRSLELVEENFTTLIPALPLLTQAKITQPLQTKVQDTMSARLSHSSSWSMTRSISSGGSLNPDGVGGRHSGEYISTCDLLFSDESPLGEGTKRARKVWDGFQDAFTAVFLRIRAFRAVWTSRQKLLSLVAAEGNSEAGIGKRQFGGDRFSISDLPLSSVTPSGRHSAGAQHP